MLDFLLEPYQSYSQAQILIEFIAALSGILSVYYSIRQNILVYPIGIISTILYTYLLYEWGLLGDMMINAYYTVMSVYGWWNWNQLKVVSNQLSVVSQKSKIGLIFIISFCLVIGIYYIKFQSLSSIPFINYGDSFITSCFLIAMYLMAQRRIEHWIFWMIGDILAIPIFIHKGYGITAIQYFVFLIMAVWGRREWKKSF